MSTGTAVHDTANLNATADLLIYCRGFCTALDEHHRGEDRALFPAIEEAHPELADTLRKLTQDHSMIDYLITALTQTMRSNATPAELERHLDGIAAIMESHFAYEERQLLASSTDSSSTPTQGMCSVRCSPPAPDRVPTPSSSGQCPEEGQQRATWGHRKRLASTFDLSFVGICVAGTADSALVGPIGGRERRGCNDYEP